MRYPLVYDPALAAQMLGACEPPECYPEPVDPGVPTPEILEWMKKQPKPKGTTPGAVAVSVSSWNTETTPAQYRLVWGDTFVGLAATYLKDGARWKELWNFQTAAFRGSHPSPDKIGVGEVLIMPAEAEANFREYLKGKGLPQPGGPRKPVGLGWYLAGGAAVLVAGYLAYQAWA